VFTSSSKNPACNLPQGRGEAEGRSLRKKQGARDNSYLEKGLQPLSEGQTLRLRESRSSREMGLQGEHGGGSVGGRGQRPYGKKKRSGKGE